MKRVNDGIRMTLHEAEEVMEALSILANLQDYDEIVGCDVWEERKKASRIYWKIDDLLISEK